MNPFILASYHSPEYFCDRQKELELLLSAISNHRNITLTAKRRIGKTALLRHLEYNLKDNKNIEFLYFDIMPSSNASDFINIFVNEFYKNFQNKIESFLEKLIKMLSGFHPTFSLNPITGESKFSIELHSQADSERSLELIFDYLTSKKKQFVIAIDEFQQITNYPEKNFEAFLRSKIQHLNNATFIFSGSSRHILESMFTDKNRPFYKSTQLFNLNKIDNETYQKFIKKHFKKNNVIISNNNIDYLLNLVQTETYYVQVLCNRLYSTGKDIITEDLIKEEFINLINENKYYYEYIKNMLTDLQWRLLESIGKEGAVLEITSKDYIAKNNLGAASSVSLAAKSLVDKELVLKESGAYVLDDILLSAWFKLH